MSNQVINFNFQDAHFIRTVTDQAGEYWFVASDVCKGLEIADAAKAVRAINKQLSDANLKGTISNRTLIETAGGLQEMVCVSEAGLNLLIMQSRKKEAMPFKWWIASGVLPTIRKTGSYNSKSTKLDRTPLRNAVSTLVGKTNLGFDEAYALVHQYMRVDSLSDIPLEQIPVAVAYVHSLIVQTHERRYEYTEKERLVSKADERGHLWTRPLADDEMIITLAEVPMLILNGNRFSKEELATLNYAISAKLALALNNGDYSDTKPLISADNRGIV